MVIAAGIAFLLLTLFRVDPVSAGTTGTLSGRVIDPEGEPVPVASVVIPGVRITYADKKGRYSLVNIPPGAYEVKVSRIGYQTVAVQDVIISADQTTTLDVEIDEAPIQMEEVIVKAERLPVELNITSTRFTLKSNDIEALPVQELDDIVNLQAGVVDGHFRGGRLGEVQYQVDGVSVNNAFDNKSSLKVDRSLLQEVQVISGTFDAEYGQAMSGVVNAVLKEGTKDFQWSAEAFGGGFLFPGREGGRLTNDEIHPGDIQNYQLTLSGPTPLPNTVFLASGRRYIFDDYVYGTRTFVPTDSSDFENKIYNPTGDGGEVPLGYTREWSGIAKLTNSSIPNVKLSYSALFNHIKGRRGDFAYRLNPDGLSKQRTVAIAHGIDWTHTLSTSMFLDVSLRHTIFEYKDLIFDDLFDPRYDAAGPPVGDVNYEDGAVIQGVQFTRFKQKTNSYLVKSAVVSQITPEHQVKVGGELYLPKVEFGTPGHLTFATVQGTEALVRHVDSPPDFPGLRAYHPLIAATFLQDQINWSDLTVRAGIRLDYFDARSKIPGDLANPANSIAGVPESVPKNTSEKFSVSPRLGVAYPIQDRASIHFAYGHFRQFPPIGEMFNNADYAILTNLQAGGVSFGVMGNPDVEPEKTVQYEIGYKHALTDDLGLDVTVFYKDIRDLLGVEFIRTYNDAEYARLTNVDFGNVLGLTVALDQRQLGPASVSLDYTWQQALGNSSDPRETSTRTEAGEDPRPRLVPFNWDQRHTLNMTVSLYEPRSYSMSAVFRLASGQPYTPILEAGFGRGLDTNSGRKPVGTVVDLRAEKGLGRQWGADVNLFGRVFNIFDARFFNGPVFNSTGSAFYSRFPEADRVALADPGRFYPPRRVEIGIRMNSD
jgi:outer membrane receptor protein involved in Fe transport